MQPNHNNIRGFEGRDKGIISILKLADFKGLRT